MLIANTGMIDCISRATANIIVAADIDQRRGDPLCNSVRRVYVDITFIVAACRPIYSLSLYTMKPAHEFQLESKYPACLSDQVDVMVPRLIDWMRIAETGMTD
jgi:hypothetical protein